MRTILVLLLISNTLLAQPPKPETPPKPENLGQAIGVAAERDYAALEARLKVLEQLVPAYVPTYTWPGHNGPEPFEALRKHMTGENIHPERFVAKWSAAELAFIHDCDHIDELLAEGKGLPILKDQRLRDWLRAKSPAKAIKRATMSVVKKLVIRRWAKKPCEWCDKAENETAVEARADGVEVVIQRDLPDHESAPQIEVCTENTCRRLIGFVPWSTIKAMR